MQIFWFLDRFRDNCCHGDNFKLVYICRRVRESGTPTFLLTNLKFFIMAKIKERMTSEIAERQQDEPRIF